MWTSFSRTAGTIAALSVGVIAGVLTAGAPAVAASTGPITTSGRSNFATWTDWSGQIEVKAWNCDWVGPAERQVATCRVDRGYVLVGGGGEVEGTAAGGGLLTGSEPMSDL